MSYHGATAGSSIANPPIRIAGGLGGINQVSTGSGGGRGVWHYASSNPSSVMAGSNFFTDAKELGVQTGDLVIGTIATGSSIQTYMGVMGTVSTAGAALASTAGGVIQGV